MILTDSSVEPVMNGRHTANGDSTARDLFSLDHRTIIVTGAMGGMGVVVAKAILQSGADVIAIDRDAEPKPSHMVTPNAGRPVLGLVFTEDLETTASSSGTIVSYHACDISNLESTAAVFEHAVSSARYPLRGLVNCAAIGWIGPSISFPVEDAKRIIEVNLIGTLVCAQAAAQLVRKQGRGLSASFVFIASMSGHGGDNYPLPLPRLIAPSVKGVADYLQGTPNAAYAASKAGVHQLTRNLASEWGHSPSSSKATGAIAGGDPSLCPSIRVNSVSPGVIRTPMTAGLLANSAFEHLWTEETMLKRLSTPEDYRGPVVFLLSDASAYVTGADLLVDGGYTGW
ncbi:hypothetical protein AYO22_06448 [Fonsecaea multimorphosa]|nr:hypothetical protein AYO22_06448 [Fonsecaea multimorphosa]